MRPPRNQWRSKAAPLVKQFLNPRESLGELDPVALSVLLAAASDIVLVVSADGRIQDMALNAEGLRPEFQNSADWLGRPWIESVTAESRPKILRLLQNTGHQSTPRQIQVNYPGSGGREIPVSYAAVPVGTDGRVVAFGRDLRAVAAMQQRLIDAQQSMERDYLQLRQIETRYRLLLELSSEPVLILDAASRRTVEVNPAARTLLGGTAKQILSRSFLDYFGSGTGEAVHALLATVRLAGRADDVQATLAADQRPVVVSAALFRQETSGFFLIRLTPIVDGAELQASATARSKLLLAVETVPDGFVVTTTDSTIVAANAAFLEMAQLDTEEQVRGSPLDQWLGRSGVDLDVLMSNLRQRGSVRLFATTLRGRHGATTEVEISTAASSSAGEGFYGLAIRNVGRRLPADSRAGRELPRTVEQLTELIGRVSLKELVREATDMIERLGIEAALELTGDNRASAAELLGLSRQSLYVKLRRYGLGELSTEPEDQE